MKSADDAQYIIAQLNTLAIAIGAALDQQIAHMYIETATKMSRLGNTPLSALLVTTPATRHVTIRTTVTKLTVRP